MDALLHPSKPSEHNFVLDDLFLNNDKLVVPETIKQERVIISQSSETQTIENMVYISLFNTIYYLAKLRITNHNSK